MAAEIILSVDRLKKSFGMLQAVKNVTFQVKQGEVVGFLGPNGAGKTTTIRLITGIFPPEGKGAILVFGHTIASDPEKYKGQIGVVPEASTAFSDFTVMQNIQFSGAIYGLSQQAIQQRASLLLDRFQLDDKRNAAVKTLSKGLKQRLNFILALLHEPRLLILDEPTSGLDPLSIQLLRKNIAEFKVEGKSVLITTHDIQEAQNLCDRVLILNRGRLIADESPSALQQRFTKTTMIQFQLSPPLDEPSEKAWLNRLPLEKTKQGYSLLSEDPMASLNLLQAACQEAGVILLHLNVAESSLEDIFLRMVQSDEFEEGTE